MRPGDFFYDLPPELIAQEPVEPRDSSRLLSVERNGTGISTGLRDLAFLDLPSLLRPDDLLVVNDTRVIPARVFGVKSTGGRVEVLLLARQSKTSWEALVRSAKRPRVGMVVEVDTEAGGDASFLVTENLGDGVFTVELRSRAPADEVIEEVGTMPLPPYIKRPEPRARDKRWYQTLFSHEDKAGSSAAPTAGLHFSRAIMDKLEKMGVEKTCVTLDVGLGTFQPIRADDVADHKMHRERYHIPEESADKINRALDQGRRVVAVGTTVTRVLEHCGGSGHVEAGSGWTELFILPGFQFKIVGALLTNFHLPESTLLMLVSAFGGKDNMLAAYEHAVSRKYRFFSYGDAMFIGDMSEEDHD